jgi:hypothetical protein
MKNSASIDPLLGEKEMMLDKKTENGGWETGSSGATLV